MDDSKPDWAVALDDREWEQVKHAMTYAQHHAKAGAPGHGQFLLIARLATMVAELWDYEGPSSTDPMSSTP